MVAPSCTTAPWAPAPAPAPSGRPAAPWRVARPTVRRRDAARLAADEPPTPPPRRPRRDRHGRGLRGRLVPADVPLARSRAEQFDDLVLDAVEDLERRWERELAGVEFAVEDVPWVEHTSPDEVVLDADVLDDGSVPLARVLPAHREDGQRDPAADRRLPAAAGDPRARPRRPRRPGARRRRRPGGRAARPRPGGDRPHRLTAGRGPPGCDAGRDDSGLDDRARHGPRRGDGRAVAGARGRRSGCCSPAPGAWLAVGARRPAAPRDPGRHRRPPAAGPPTTCPASSSTRRASRRTPSPAAGRTRAAPFPRSSRPPRLRPLAPSPGTSGPGRTLVTLATVACCSSELPRRSPSWRRPIGRRGRTGAGPRRPVVGRPRPAAVPAEPAPGDPGAGRLARLRCRSGRTASWRGWRSRLVLERRAVGVTVAYPAGQRHRRRAAGRTGARPRAAADLELPHRRGPADPGRGRVPAHRRSSTPTCPLRRWRSPSTATGSDQRTVPHLRPAGRLAARVDRAGLSARGDGAPADGEDAEGTLVPGGERAATVGADADPQRGADRGLSATAPRPARAAVSPDTGAPIAVAGASPGRPSGRRARASGLRRPPG